MRLTLATLAAAAGLAVGPAAAGPLDAPGAAKTLTCTACHGPAGNSAVDTVPVLAGMAPDYFKKTIEDYAAGRRPSPEMEPYAKAVKALRRRSCVADLVEMMFGPRLGRRSWTRAPATRT